MKQDDLQQLRDLVERMAPRPLAKTVRDPRSVFRSEIHAAFVAAVDYLLTLPGWSLRRLAQEMGCDHVTLGDWLKYGDERRNQIPGWVFPALPRPARVVYLRHMMAWGENDSTEGTGTNG